MQSAEYNLNSFVTDEIFDTENLEIDDKKIREFFGLISKIVLEEGKEYFSQLMKENAKYKNCTDFFGWLYEYAVSINNAYQMTEGIRNLENEEFEKLLDYCLENLILHNVGFETAVKQMQGQELYRRENLKSMANLINNYYHWIFIRGVSKDGINHRMCEMAGISEDKCSFLWDRYLKKEDLLWKKYSLELQNEINGKLDLFFKVISEVEEEE